MAAPSTGLPSPALPPSHPTRFHFWSCSSTRVGGEPLCSRSSPLPPPAQCLGHLCPPPKKMVGLPLVQAILLAHYITEDCNSSGKRQGKGESPAACECSRIHNSVPFHFLPIPSCPETPPFPPSLLHLSHCLPHNCITTIVGIGEQ